MTGIEVTLAPSLLNADGSVRVGQANNPGYEAAVSGRRFLAVSAVGGIALIAPAAGGGHPTLFNPKGSGVNVFIRRLVLSWVSGNNAPGAVEWAATLNAGAMAATGGAVLTATKVAVTNVIAGGPVASQVIWSPTTNTFTSAPAFLRPAGISLFTGIGTTAVAPFKLEAEYDDFGVAPDTAVSLCFQAATTTALFQIGITFDEIPV